VFEPPTYYQYGVEDDVEPGPTRMPAPTTRRRPSRSLEKAIALEGTRPKRNYLEVEVWVSISSKVSFSLRK
jgi:hypothetical protein